MLAAIRLFQKHKQPPEKHSKKVKKYLMGEDISHWSDHMKNDIGLLNTDLDSGRWSERRMPIGSQIF